MPASQTPSQLLEQAECERASQVEDRLDELNRLRAGLARRARTGVKGELQPVPKSGPWQTPLLADRLAALVAEARGANRKSMDAEPLLREAARQGELDDLRLLPVLLEGLSIPSRDIWYRVADEIACDVLPKLGAKIVPELVKGFPWADAANAPRWLLALCRIDPKAGTKVCLRLLDGESTPLKGDALGWLRGVGSPAEAELAGLRFCRHPDERVRTAARFALDRATSDEALEVLVGWLVEPRSGSRHGGEDVLAGLPHPGTTGRLLRELEERLAVLAEAMTAQTVAKKKGRAGRGSAEARQRREEAQLIVESLVRILGNRKHSREDRPAVARALVPLVKHPAAGDPAGFRQGVPQVAIASLGSVGAPVPEVIPLFRELLQSPRPGIVQEAAEALGAMSPAERGPLVPQLLDLARKAKSGSDLRRTINWLLAPHYTEYHEEIHAFLRDLLWGRVAWQRTEAIDTIGEIGPPARDLLPDLLALVRQGQYVFSREEPAPPLNCVDPDGAVVIPALLDILKDTTVPGMTRLGAAENLSYYGRNDEAARIVRGLIEAGENKKWDLSEPLTRLESHPGETGDEEDSRGRH